MAISYPYIHPAPFKHDMRYDYADCQSDAFMRAWRQARVVARKRFLRVNNAENPGDDASTNECILLEKLLLQCQIGNESAHNTLWALLKKFEVFGRLHSHYTPELRRHPNSQLAAYSDYILLAETLIMFAQKESALQYLSTLLKIMDSFCSLDPCILTKQDSRRIIALIDLENSLIENLGI